MENIESKVRRIVSNVTGLPPQAPGSADLYLELGVASVHAIQLLTMLEEGFGIAIPDDDFVQATSINNLVRMIAGLKGDSAPA